MFKIIIVFNKIYNFLVNKWFFDKILVRGIAYNVLINTKVIFNYIEDIYKSMKNTFDKNRNPEIENFKKHVSDINGQNIYIEIFGLLISGVLCFVVDLTDTTGILTDFFVIISDNFNIINNFFINQFYNFVNSSFIEMTKSDQLQYFNQILKEDYSYLIDICMSKEGKFVLLIILFFILFTL